MITKLTGKSHVWTILDSPMLGSGGNSKVYRAIKKNGDDSQHFALELFTETDPKNESSMMKLW